MQKERRHAKKNEREKSESAEREKNREFSLFTLYATPQWKHGSPVPDPKITRQGETQGS
jgi:hypothetical protein